MAEQLPVRKTIGLFSTRGIPPRHGAFETTAWFLSAYLARRGYRVIVQSMDNIQATASETLPDGVEVRAFHRAEGFRGDLMYDRAAFRAMAADVDAAVIFGYSSATFWGSLRRRQVPIVLNPDGLEWRRPKFPLHLRLGLRMLQGLAVRQCDQVVVDSPSIQAYLEATYGRRFHFAAYGADEYQVTEADLPFADRIRPNEYFLVLGRLEPSCLTEEIVREYSASGRKETLLVVGPSDETYQRRLQRVAGPNVIFTGGFYGNRKALFALRRYCLAYIDGHHTGGINPSTIEALMAGRHVIAHDNPHIRAAVGDLPVTLYNLNRGDLASCLRDLRPATLSGPNPAYTERARTAFSWDSICATYELALEQAMRRSG